MSFIRRELRDTAWRARELLGGGKLVLIGLWAGIAGSGILAVLGWIATLIGALLAIGGFQRYRFRNANEGPGLVQVTEGQIAYLGPINGGIVATDMLEEIAIDPTGHPVHWVLRQKGSEAVFIPVTAAGGEALFDVFGALPGFDTAEMLRRLDAPGNQPVVIWRREAKRLS